MGLGSTAKKLQTLGDRAEQLYARVGELKEQLQDLRNKVETTSEQVDSLENRVARQEALLEAIAQEHDIDAESILAEEVIEDAEGDGAEGEGASEESDRATEGEDAETAAPAEDD